MAAVHDDIAAMPMGYNTLIGDMGAALVGRPEAAHPPGARALQAAEDPASSTRRQARSTSSASARSTRRSAQLELTRIIVAHRPETIASAQRVIVLQGGRVAQDLRRVAAEAAPRSA